MDSHGQRPSNTGDTPARQLSSRPVVTSRRPAAFAQNSQVSSECTAAKRHGEQQNREIRHAAQHPPGFFLASCPTPMDKSSFAPTVPVLKKTRAHHGTHVILFANASLPHVYAEAAALVLLIAPLVKVAAAELLLAPTVRHAALPRACNTSRMPTNGTAVATGSGSRTEEREKTNSREHAR